MALLFKYHVLDNILLEVWVLENLMLYLCDKEQEEESHINVVLFHQAYALHQDYVELHRLFGLVLLLAWCVAVMMHYLGTIFSVDVVRIGVSINVDS